MHAALPDPLKARLTFTLADFADVDLASMVREAASAAAAERRNEDGGQAGSAPPSLPSTSALIFINNLAFPPGVSLRHARQLRGVGAELRGEGAEVTVVSSVPLPALEGEEDGAALPPLPPVSLTLAMSFNPAHDARVYAA